jgi:hypothetical protein
MFMVVNGMFLCIDKRSSKSHYVKRTKTVKDFADPLEHISKKV